MTARYPRIVLRGDARERGHTYGRLARDKIAHSLAEYERLFSEWVGWNWPRVTDAARRFEQPIADYESRYLEEIRGIAEGAGAEFDDILAINLRTEVIALAWIAQGEAATLPPPECSSLAVMPEGSRNGHLLLAQNWDWLEHAFETTVLVEAHQNDRPNFVTFVEAGLLAKAGMNSAGIGVVTNALVSARDGAEPGVPYHVILRAILDSQALSDALDAIQRAPRASAANFLIADAAGTAIDAESGPGDYREVFLNFPAGDTICHTNHFTDARFEGRDVGLWATPCSPVRQERMRRLLAAAGGPLAVEDLQSVLADHANYPRSICYHPDARVDANEQAATVVSLVMDLEARRISVAEGQPCRTPYRTLDLADVLSGPGAAQGSDGEQTPQR